MNNPTNNESLNKQITIMSRAQHEDRASHYQSQIKAIEAAHQLKVKAENDYRKHVAAVCEQENIKIEDERRTGADFLTSSIVPHELSSKIYCFLGLTGLNLSDESYKAETPSITDLLDKVLAGQPFSGTKYWLERLFNYGIADNYIAQKNVFEKVSKFKSENAAQFVIGRLIESLLNIEYDLAGANKVVWIEQGALFLQQKQVECESFKITFDFEYIYDESPDQMTYVTLELKKPELLAHINSTLKGMDYFKSADASESDFI